VEIVYGDRLSKILENVKNPERHYRIILSHEVWHLIEYEKKIHIGLIGEGTATYAMKVYENNVNTLNKKVKKAQTTGITNFRELKYEYCAAIVNNQLGTSNIRRLFDEDMRKKIDVEYKKNLRIQSPKIFASEMKTTPWIFRGYINDFFGIENKQDFFINELEKSEIYDSLIPNDKNKIIQTYGIIQERIRRRK
jgi:hypothetical protein